VLSRGTITPEAAKVNGYDENVWQKEAISFKEFMHILNCCFIDGKKLQWAGSNPKFDYDFIEAHCAREKIEFKPSLYSHHFLDVGSMCWPLLHSGKVSSIRQNKLATYYILGEQTHGAADDVDQCIKIYQAYMKTVMPKTPVHR
jgi:DNA polymerase III epsilon subunit-like protein